MSFSLGTAMFNANNSLGAVGGSGDLQPLITQWQIQTCGGVPVGDPTPALQVVAINKVQTAICNPQEIIGTYNRVERTVLTAGNTITIDANTKHSITIKCVSGNGEIDIAGASSGIDAGESESYTASKTIDQEIIVTCTIGKIVVITIGDAALT